MAKQLSKADIVVIALLYNTKEGNDFEKQRLEHAFKTVQNDHVLNKMIHLCPVDHPKLKNWARHNTSKTTVTQYPVFVVRIGAQQPQLYTLGDSNTVFNMAHYHYGRLNNLTGPAQPPNSTSQMTGQTMTYPSAGPNQPVVVVMPDTCGNPVLDGITMAEQYCSPSSSSSSSSSPSSSSSSSSASPAPCKVYSPAASAPTVSSSSPSESSSSSSSSHHHHRRRWDKRSQELLDRVEDKKYPRQRRGRKSSALIEGVVFDNSEKGQDVDVDTESDVARLKKLADELRSAI
jgi:hypothetical protein